MLPETPGLDLTGSLRSDIAIQLLMQMSLHHKRRLIQIIVNIGIVEPLARGVGLHGVPRAVVERRKHGHPGVGGGRILRPRDTRILPYVLLHQGATEGVSVGGGAGRIEYTCVVGEETIRIFKEFLIN